MPTSSPTSDVDPQPDLLTPLPDEMVDAILSRLPTRDAIRTSTLAHPWQRRWANCPNLTFEFFSYEPPSVVDAVLEGYACPFREIRIEVAEESFGRADAWLHILADKGVRSLSLCFIPEPSSDSDLPVLPTRLFSCSGLTSLILQCCEIPLLPSSIEGLPNLACLVFSQVIFPQHGERTLETLIAKSPNLEILYIMGLSIDSADDGRYDEWVIQAPNLKVLSIYSDKDYGWQIQDLSSLEDASLCLDGPQLARILSGLTRVKKLFVFRITDDNILEGLSLSFVDLKSLSFGTPFSKLPSILSKFCSLAPNLEDLSIMILHDHDHSAEVDMEFLTVQCIDRLFSNIKYIRLKAIMGQSNEMQFIEFLLSKARVLQIFEVFVHDDGSKSMEDVSIELEKYKKASSQAALVVSRSFGDLVLFDETDAD